MTFSKKLIAELEKRVKATILIVAKRVIESKWIKHHRLIYCVMKNIQFKILIETFIKNPHQCLWWIAWRSLRSSKHYWQKN